MEFPELKDVNPLGGFSFALGDARYGPGVFLRLQSDKVVMLNDFVRGEPRQFPIAASYSLKLGFWDDGTEVRVDGAHVYRMRGKEWFDPATDFFYLCIGGGVDRGSEIRFSHIRMRKLKEEPPMN